MANRVLRDWTQSETVNDLSEGAEVFFTRLIMKADDFGCYYGNPKLLLAALFPLKDYDHHKMLSFREECQCAGLIKVYAHDGKEYVQIINFGQRLRQMNSKFPQPVNELQTNDSTPLPDDSRKPPEEKRNEEKKKSSPKKFSDDYYQSKEEAFEEIKQDDLYMDEVHRTVTGKGWRVATKVHVLVILKKFLIVKADLESGKKNVRQHFKNYLFSQSVSNLVQIADEG